MKRKSIKPVIGLALVLGMAMAGVSSATLVQANTAYDLGAADELGAATTTGDLILSGATTLSSSFTGGGAVSYGGWPIINDGTFLSGGSVGNILGTDGITADFAWSVFELDVSVNTLGYDVSEIQSTSNWSQYRSWQAFEIKYALVGETITTGVELTHSLGTFIYTTPAASLIGTLVQLTDDAGDVLSGISAIEIKYHDIGYGNNGTAYTEFSVIGAAAVPEPATLGLMGMFGVASVFIRKYLMI